MTERNDTPNAPAAKGDFKPDRFLTVQLVPEPRPRIPWIRLRGLWLAQAGFTPQSRIRVRVMNGCLVITPE
jgi:toxic protein SymE